jgi:hypothetical protein
MNLDQAIDMFTDLREKIGNGNVKVFVPLKSFGPLDPEADGETIVELERAISMLVDDGEKPGFLRPVRATGDEDMEVMGIVVWPAQDESEEEEEVVALEGQ